MLHLLLGTSLVFLKRSISMSGCFKIRWPRFNFFFCLTKGIACEMFYAHKKVKKFLLCFPLWSSVCVYKCINDCKGPWSEKGKSVVVWLCTSVLSSVTSEEEGWLYGMFLCPIITLFCHRICPGSRNWYFKTGWWMSIFVLALYRGHYFEVAESPYSLQWVPACPPEVLDVTETCH